MKRFINQAFETDTLSPCAEHIWLAGTTIIASVVSCTMDFRSYKKNI